MSSLLWLVPLLLWFSNRYAWWRKPVDWSRPRVLMYHMVSEHRPKAKFNGLRVTPERFDRQLAWLSQQGFSFYTVSELMAQWPELPAKSVAITFDDGYADNMHNALPLLTKYNAKATIYVVVDRHNRDWSTYKKAHHNSGELAGELKLSDADVTQLMASGRIEIGSHTLTHCNLATTSIADKRHELLASKQALETLLASPVTSFAYPFGIYGRDDLSLVESAGYTSAVTTVDGIDLREPVPNPFDLKRIKISGKDNQLAFVMRMRGGRRGWKK